jgi:CAP12/Pycsar effector protein, TIR domain/TIR domain
MKVFLSYASEDREGADRVARWLDDKGVAFFDFRAPDRNGGRFATSRPEAMAAADFMLVLLSPALLNSKWCRQDLEMGLDQLRTRSDPDAAFIHVLQVADVPGEYDGDLLSYDWIDFTSPRRAESALRELSYRLMIAWRPTAKGNDGHDAVIRPAKPTPQPEPALPSDEHTVMTDDKMDDKHKKVMVIYGHDTEANKALFDCLRAMSLQPQEWGQLIRQSQVGSPYIGAVLDAAFRNVQAVVAFFTPDEHVLTRAMGSASETRWRLQARPNVLIEAGMAFATHPRETILLVLGDQDLPSDLAGRHFIRLDGTPASLKYLFDRLKTAGCAVEESSTDWLDPNRFPRRDNVPARPRWRKPPDADLPRTGR